MRARTAVLIAALIAGAPAEGRDYESCIALAERRPDAALAEAERWSRAGGGAAAEHCAAMALAADGALRAASRRLSDAAARSAAPAEVRAEMFTQAAGFWLEAGEAALAAEAARRAATLAPRAAEPQIALAEAAAAQEDWPGARAALDRALAARPGDPQALTLRAAARRNAGDAAGAIGDAEAALAAAPGAPDALVERGAAALALGRRDLAVESWFDAIAAGPDTPAAERARLALEDLALR